MIVWHYCGMNQQTTQAPAYISQIAKSLKLDIVEVLPAQKGYRNHSYGLKLRDGTWLNFILYKDERGIVSTMHAAHRIGDYAARYGRPARFTYTGHIIKMVARPTLETIDDYPEIRYGGLYYYLPGETISWDAYTRQHLKLLGEEMGKLHATLKPARIGYFLPSVARMNQQWVGLMRRYFSHQTIIDAIETKLGITFGEAQQKQLRDFKKILEACDHVIDQQALHMDFVRGNILFLEEPELHISGILDFEKTARGHVLFDVARTLAFLLVDCKGKTPDKIYSYFIDSGYNKRGGGQLRQLFVRVNGHRYDVLEELVTYFMFYDWFKFLRHNPYEALHENEHFQRTTALLRQRGVL